MARKKTQRPKSGDGPFDDHQDKFLRIISDGGTWRSACDEIGVSSFTIAGWLRDDAEFAKHYARAADIRADAIFEDILGISDDASLDPNDRRIRIDARKWLLGKMKPKVYGDKQSVELGGPDGGPIETITKIERVIVRPSG